MEALEQQLEQPPETVTRNSRVDIVAGGIDEIDPPEELDEFAEQARTTGPVRKNLRQWCNDVVEPGYRVEAESEATEAFFMGGDAAPEETPDGGFLENAAIFAGERETDFYDFLKETVWQRWVRGTILVELLKNDRDDAESEITGFYHIRPETVYPQVLNNTNILLPPDQEDLPPDISEGDYETTPRGEVAAYIQFDDESILGVRRQGFGDATEVPLSQNDVMKQTLEPDIGSDFGTDGGEGVFGTSIIEGISDDIAEYKQIKRDRAEAISRKAYGIWTMQFADRVLDLGNQKEVVRWGENQIRDTERELNNLGKGDVLTSDAQIDLERHDGEVPDLNEVLSQYISIMLAPLPAPKYMIGFAEGINRDVTEEQKEAYHDLVSEERRYQEKKWTAVLKEVARRWGLDASGLQLKIKPEKEENPVKSLSTDEIERMNTYVATLNQAAGPAAAPTSLVSSEQLLEVLDFPTEEVDDPEQIADDMAEQAEENPEAMRETWNDIMLESMATRFSEGDVVQTPQGRGVITGVFTESPTEDVEASEGSPTYAVALMDARVGHEFYSASELDGDAELPEGGPESPTDDVEAMWNIINATEGQTEALDFTPPESWRESDIGPRAVALKAWAGMNGQFDCGGACCKGEMRPKLGDRGSDEFCASFKDYILGTDEWRGWGD